MSTKAARKRERDARRFERQFLSKERVAFVKSLPCVKCKRILPPPWMHVHHDPVRAKSTYKDTSSVCGDCHTFGPGARHTVGVVTFWKQVGISYEESNAATEKAWLEYKGCHE